jgi:hypothetical protein
VATSGSLWRRELALRRYQTTIGRLGRGGHVDMRRGRRENGSDQKDREAFALLDFCIEFRLCSQAIE